MLVVLIVVGAIVYAGSILLLFGRELAAGRWFAA